MVCLQNCSKLTPRSCRLGGYAYEIGPVAILLSLQGEQHTEVVGHRSHVAGLWVHLPSEMLQLARPAHFLLLIMKLHLGQQ